MYDIHIENLSFAYEDKHILKDINIDIKSGEFICILGPSGCGKSTLLKLMSGLIKPTGGKILINGKHIEAPGLDRGVVFQDYSLFSWMSTGKNIELALEQAYKNMGKKEREKIAKEYLGKVGLKDVYSKLPGNLSGGMRQRAAIARAFAINPPILLMDEPFGALDAVTRAKLQDLTLYLWNSSKKEKKTIIFVTHDVDEALLIAEKIIIMGSYNKGIERIIEIDSKEYRDRRNIYLNSYFLELKEELIKMLDF
ncbi:ABC transporter ATP-binding protein [Clostridium sporogenes]|uniref:ABC transporter ATP-binding protein n=1 Tax=unclassified Clostridium TaxID=2614128 RepID=UPI0013D18A7F|nr:ABC transporter ATP-binding protein [Clostridium sporogenes]NFS26958.1 ABC transporter ATP-binding protein [Clostridium sporogenes]